MLRRLGIGAGAALLAASVPLLAHHSLWADYDPGAPVTLRGPITKVDWRNPHVFLSLVVTTPEGKAEPWQVETGGPIALTRSHISREMLALDTIVTINGFRAKDRTTKAGGRDITFPDGKTYALILRQERPPAPPTPPSAADRLGYSLPYLIFAAPVLVLAIGLWILRRQADGRKALQ